MNLPETSDLNVSYEMLCSLVPVAVVLVDRNGQIVAVNEAMCSICEVCAEALVGRFVDEFSVDSRRNINTDFKHFDSHTENVIREVRIHDRICVVLTRPARNFEDVAILDIITLTDITAYKNLDNSLKVAFSELEYQAHHDALTGLLNSRTYYEVCTHLIAGSDREQKPYSVLFADIDHFKNVNDQYGHDIGDIVLQQVSECIIDGCRRSDLVGRVGGEEFSIFAPNTSKRGALVLAEKIRRNIENLNCSVYEEDIHITVSIGVVNCTP